MLKTDKAPGLARVILLTAVFTLVSFTAGAAAGARIWFSSLLPFS